MLGLATGQLAPPTGPSLQVNKRAQSVLGKGYPMRWETWRFIFSLPMKIKFAIGDKLC